METLYNNQEMYCQHEWIMYSEIKGRVGIQNQWKWQNDFFAESYTINISLFDQIKKTWDFAFFLGEKVLLNLQCYVGRWLVSSREFTTQ